MGGYHLWTEPDEYFRWPVSYHPHWDGYPPGRAVLYRTALDLACAAYIRGLLGGGRLRYFPSGPVVSSTGCRTLLFAVFSGYGMGRLT